MSQALDLAKRHSQLKSDRSQWTSHWLEVAERVLPRQADFFGSTFTPGAKRTEKIYDSTGEIALTKFAAVMEALLTPRTQTWHKLKSRSEALNEVHAVKVWFEQVNKIMFAARNSPRARFATMAHEGYMSLGAFGTAAMFIDKAPMGPLLYKSCHIGQVYFAENAWGVVDTVHREFDLTARQAGQKFKRERLPSKINTAIDKSPDQKFTFVHCVKPNEERDETKRDYSGMPWASYYFTLENPEVVDEGGYNSFPWAISRYVTAPSEVYGRSPAMTALPDIKLLNEAMKTTHRMWHNAIDPPWLTADEFQGVLHSRPGANNRGGLTDDGKPRALPMIPGSNFEVNNDLTMQKRDTINDVFLVRILQIILENPQMTATQVLEIAQQKGVLLAPVMGRQQSEFLGPLIEREFDLLYEAGMLPDLPDELIEAGGEYDVDYESPLALAQKAQQGLSVMRTLESIAPFIPVRPDLLDKLNLDRCLELIGESNGLAADAWNDDETVDEIRTQRAQQQAAQAAVEGAGGMRDAAAAAKDFSVAYDDEGRVSNVRAA